jgi:opacity protein-like surface antigen
VQGQLSYGQQKEGAVTPDASGRYRDSRWYGVSGLAGYAITPRLQGLVRADYLKNDKNGGGLYTYNGYSFIDENGLLVYGNDGRNGIGPDLAGDLDRGANRYALTVGLKYALNQNTTLKAEYRFDGADRAVFEDVDSGSFKKNNQLLGASVVVFF